MDIVTHGMMGLAVAAPFLGTETGGAVGFVLGSTLPDLDVFSRCFGKRAFLHWHQGWSHSLPVQLTTGTSAWLVTRWLAPDLSPLIIGLLAGAMTHSLLDLSNTYGIRIAAPFSRRRFCFEWMFFIDSVVLLLTLAALVPAVRTLVAGSEPYPTVAIAYVTSLVIYAVIKAFLRRRAGRLSATDTVSVIPSALLPWVFFICQRTDDEVTSSRLNVVTNKSKVIAQYPIYDEEFVDELSRLEEFRAMSALSPAYHVIERSENGDNIHIRCRDMRILNFDTSFGILDVTFDKDRHPTAITLNV